MFKTAPGRLSPAALLFALVGLAGCHVSFGSGSSSQSPGGMHSKPAHHTPSKSGRATKPTSKAIPKTQSKSSGSKPAAPAADDKTSDGPHRDQPAATNDPKRTPPANDPTRTQPTDDDPARTPKYIGGKDKPEDPSGNGASTIDRPANVTAPTKKPGGAKEVDRPATVTAPQ